jgi:rhodanese-related sulfurtransferase/DNA-binding transcriptional ArsR family regulator
MKGREFKDAIYSGLSKLLRALANPARLEIIEMLSQGEKSVEGIVQTTGLTIANASQHLQVLKNSNILKSRKEGHYVYYSLTNDEILNLYQQISKYAINEIAELEKVINRQRTDNHSTNAVSLDELNDFTKNNNVLLLDVRPTIEYEFGHITGAVSMPMNELIEKLNQLPIEKEIIAYCRGPFCVLADEAVKVLREKGYKVRRLDEGYPEWKIKQIEANN